MITLFGSQTQREWEAHLAEIRQRWRALSDQTAALRTRQEETLHAVFSGAGLTDAEAHAEVTRYLQGVDASRSASSLAEFVRPNHDHKQGATQIPPPAIEDVPGLIAALQAEWEQMFSRLRDRLPSPRGQALLATRKSPGLPVRSLAEAALWPVKDIAPLHDPDENERVSSLGLDGDEEKSPNEDAPPKRTEGVGDRIAEMVREHLHLQREIKRMDDFWTGEAAGLTAFINARPPEPTTAPDPAAPARKWWQPSTWFRKSTRGEAAALADSTHAVWRAPVPSHVPTNPGIAWQLHEWRARTEKEAENLRAADAGWTQRVAAVGEELTARRATEAKHPALALEPESIAQAELEKARSLQDGEAVAALQCSVEARAWISAALPDFDPPTES